MRNCYAARMNAILCAVLAGLAWGVGEIFTKSAINSREVGPFAAALVRAAVTLPLAALGLMLAQWLLKTEPPEWWRGMRGITWSFALCFAVLTVVLWRYLFTLPIVFSVVITVCLALAAWVSPKAG